MSDLDHRQVADVNRKYYSETAHLYDATETCVISPWSQRMLENDLDLIIQMIGDPPGKISALDGCGGSGNVSLKLLRRGLKVTLCDISRDLTNICIAKAQATRAKLTIVNSEITEFLEADANFYDLIVYSSALHHLVNYVDVLRLSLQRLKPGGIVYTIFDPTPRHSLGFTPRILLGLDYFWFKLRYQPIDMIFGMMRKYRRIIRSISGNVYRLPEGTVNDINKDYWGVLAEYHARTGIDDIWPADQLKEMGYSIILHERYADARHAPIRQILAAGRKVTAFKFLLQKPVQDLQSDALPAASR